MHRPTLTWTDKQIEGLSPGSFAFVMATGIVSNAAQTFGALSDLLFAVGVLAFAWLGGLRLLPPLRLPPGKACERSNDRSQPAAASG
jgi:hypothetical protein